ncbi:hypothetical protein D3C84_766830 [compost metagenome]
MRANQFKGISNFIKVNPEAIRNLTSPFEGIAAILENYQKQFGRFSEKAAEKGWFVTSCTDIKGMASAYSRGDDELDNFMEAEIESNFDKIKASIITANEARAHILNPAFDLHSSNNWVASIPLFLAQTDGIFSAKIGAFLFSEHEKRKNLILEKYGQKSSGIIPYMCSPFEVYTQFGASIGSKSKDKKKQGPNRNGILHGSRKHLDYATKINSLKCISLLSYINMFFDIEST